VLVLAGILFLARLGERALWSEEVRWAEIPRAMERSSDYFWPTINGRLYYDKPLGSYWLVLLAARITGGVAELAARLPSALAGLLAVTLLMAIARRLYDLRTAVLAGLILATSFGFVFWARTASADIENVAGVLAALWLFLGHEQRGPGGWILLLWQIMAVTSLTKGLLGFVLPILIIGIYASLGSVGSEPVAGSRLRTLLLRNRWLLNFWSLLAIPLAAGVYLMPFLISNHAEASGAGLRMVYRENILRFFNSASHRGPIYLYAYTLFELLAPWSLLLPAAVVLAHRNKADRFALVYFWSVFIFFTLSSSRRSYYLLPILPAGALLVARLLAVGPAFWTKAVRLLVQVGCGLLAVGLFLSAIALVPPLELLPAPWKHLPPMPCLEVFAGIWVVSMVVLVLILTRTGLRPGPLALAWGLIATLGMAYLFLFALPDAEKYRTQKGFAEKIRRELQGQTHRLGLYDTNEIVFYLDPGDPLPEFQKPEQLQQGIRELGLRYILLRRRHQEVLAGSARPLRSEPGYPWEGPGQEENKLVLMFVDP